MKILLKILVIYLFVFNISNNGYSQKFGLKLGANSSFMHITNSEGRLGTDPITNILAGITIGPKSDTALTWSFDLYYSPKGYGIYGNKLRLNYLDLDLKYKAALGKTNLFVPFGIYLGYGLNGKSTIKYFDSYDVKFGSENEEYSRFDFGLILGFGIKHKYFQASLQYKHGLVDIDHLNTYSFRSGLVNLSVDFYIN